MTDSKFIYKIFKESDIKHGLSLFNIDEIDAIEQLIEEENDRFLIRCQIRNILLIAKPEEIVRQIWIYKLITEYGYPKKRISVEKTITFGVRESGLADIVILHKDLSHFYLIFEIKRPSRNDGLNQLRSYCNAEGSPIGVWSNGNEMIRLHREEPNIFVEIPRIPRFSETLTDILTERWNIIWLENNDELKKGKTTLKKILNNLEELVLGNAGVDPFEEIFKLIYAKLFDEWQAINDPNFERVKKNDLDLLKEVFENPKLIRTLPDTHALKNLYQLNFFVGDRNPAQIKTAIKNLLEGAKRQWRGVFEPTERIELRDDHLKVCISFLEKIKLFNSNLQIIDEAFEHLIPQVSKKKEGQFFTPRSIVNMIVKMLNPKPTEFIVDPACGSAGFLLHSIMWIAGGTISGRELPSIARNFAQNNVFGIDFAKKVIKIAKAINLIVGDGRAHVYKDNSLAPQTWSDETKSGLRPRLLRFPNNQEKDIENQNSYFNLDFDVLMTNPPFAGTVKERAILRLYKLTEKNNKFMTKIGRHILFLERSLQLLRPGGRMAIVLPQGLLNNLTANYIRNFIINEAFIISTIGLHENTFKPHTSTKTSILFLQKYTNEKKLEMQKIKLKLEKDWHNFFKKLKKKYEDVNWKSQVKIKNIDYELISFIKQNFDIFEDFEVNQIFEVKDDEKEENGDDDWKSIAALIKELGEVKKLLDEKENELTQTENELQDEIEKLKKKIKNITEEISMRTLGGQIYLTLNKKSIIKKFKKFWIEDVFIKKIDYPIFFGVNRKPIKDNTGEYRYLRKENGEFLIDENGHPIIDHDLDEIAKSFIKFAKEVKLNFWIESK